MGKGCSGGCLSGAKQLHCSQRRWKCVELRRARNHLRPIKEKRGTCVNFAKSKEEQVRRKKRKKRQSNRIM